MISKRSTLFLAAGLLCTLALFARTPQEQKLPDTPVARQFDRFLKALESGDHEKYIKEHFTQQFLDAFPLADHLRFFQQVQAMHGGFTVHAIEEASDYDLTVLVKSKKRDAWRRIDFHTEPQLPHRVAGMGIDRASSPEEAQPLKRMPEGEILQWVESELKWMEENDTFSGAVLIAKNGQPLLKKACGMASKEFNVPNRVDTKFNIGSINKSFTQMAIAQLFEKGCIRLEDPIGKYVEGFPEDVAEKVTIQHLLTMQSGMGHYWNRKWFAKWAEIKTVDDLMETIKEVPLDFEPGTRTQYSNSGYVVLGAIVEKVTGQSYYDYVREHIFQPVGMENTDSYELDQIITNLARGYTVNRSTNPYNKNRLQNNLFLHSVKGSPAGGGYSTLDDLNRYVEALKKNTLTGEKYTNLVLGLFQNLDHPEQRPREFGIAGGATVGINGVIEADFESGYTVVVLSNYDPPVAEDLSTKILRMLKNRAPE